MAAGPTVWRPHEHPEATQHSVEHIAALPNRAAYVMQVLLGSLLDGIVSPRRD
jgi:hypothetical protein